LVRKGETEIEKLNAKSEMKRYETEGFREY